MAASKVSMKLLVDRDAKKVLFAEAGKDTVDFLFTILSLPVGTIIRLLTKSQMVGSVGNLYASVEGLSEDYIQPNQNKYNLLKPKTPLGTPNSSLLKLPSATTATTPTTGRKFYKCSYQNSHNYVTDSCGAYCPNCCSNTLIREVKYVAGSSAETTNISGSAGDGFGFVKEVVTYMVMDNLVIKPMSTISGITLLTKFNVKDIAALEEMTVTLNFKMALKLLKESFSSEEVLTRAFLLDPPSLTDSDSDNEEMSD